MIHRFKIVATVVAMALVLACLAVPADAQNLDGRRFVGGLGGATFGTASSSGVFGVQVGQPIGQGTHLIGEFGRFMDVLPADLADLVEEFEDEISDDLGVPVTLEVTIPATYGLVGARWSRAVGRQATAFVEGGVGAARVTVKIREATLGGSDVSEFVEDIVGAEAPTAMEFLFAGGGGVNILLTEDVSVDAGYRFTRIATDDPNANVSAVYGAVKIRW